VYNRNYSSRMNIMEDVFENSHSNKQINHNLCISRLAEYDTVTTRSGLSITYD